MENSSATTLLGKDLSVTQKFAAFGSIVVIYFFYCYNFMLGTFVRPTMIKAVSDGGFGFNLRQASAIFAIMSFATIPGTLFFGMVTTKIGKKRTLMILGLWFATFTFLPLLSPTNFTLWRMARFAAGFGLGGMYGTGIPLVTELFESKYRGKLAATMTATFSFAMMFAGKMYGFLGDENWRILVLSAVIPPIIGVILVFFNVPDDKELTVERAQKVLEEKGEKVSYLSMYRGKYALIGLGCIVLSGMNFLGYSGFGNNATTYLKTVLNLSAATAGTIYSLQGLGQLFGYAFWGLMSDKFGRKFPAIGMLLSSGLVFLYMNTGAENISTFKLLSVGIGFCFGFSAAWGAYYTELFPKRFSGLAAGASFNGGRLISTFGLPMLAGVALTSAGMQGIFKIVIVIFVLGSILWFFLPETLNKEREE
ncbi:MFS transporter [uncultured Ilyobacter sp.]|uniref:MFS transporter n=1 Tax=uncultured Ilyobacter sp. TaxID=544433 RepID=UPI0029C7D690|nr:MFS transporter [uncultured Ilyobacter sp.]